jgi:Ca2+-binding RTX toxin-like protein
MSAAPSVALMRSTIALLSVTAGLVASTGVAAASTVQVEGGAAVFRSGSRASDLVTQDVGLPAFSFADALQSIGAGAGCTAGSPVTCNADRQDIRLSNKADRFRGDSSFPISVTAGGGADSIRAGGGENTVSGGDGNDDIWANGNSGSTLYGGSGADRIYGFETEPLLEGDGSGDLLVMAASTFGGQSSGGDGSDELVNRGIGRASLSGDGGNDVIVLDSSFLGSTASGGTGNDTLQGGPGADTLTGGSGSDAIVSAGDGEIDSVDCGSGFDIAYADADDDVSHCEIVVNGDPPALPQVTAARADAQDLVDEMPAF